MIPVSLSAADYAPVIKQNKSIFCNTCHKLHIIKISDDLLQIWDQGSLSVLALFEVFDNS